MPVLPRAVALAALVGLGLSGCTSIHDSPGKTTAGQQPSPNPVTSVPPTASTRSSAPVPAATLHALSDRLLATAEVPGLDATWHWQNGRTGAAGSEPFGTCARATLISIGASAVVERTYFPPVDTDDYAAEQIAEFADTATASRAAAVLGSWRAGCAAKVGSDATVTASKQVSVSRGTGSWYLVTSFPSDAGETRFGSIGMVRDGTRIAVLDIESGGRAYSYKPGSEPMVAMVRAAASALG